MASVFSYYVACFHYSSDRDDALTKEADTGFMHINWKTSSSLTAESFRLSSESVPILTFRSQRPSPFTTSRTCES
jgi:hypothetical protein